MITEKIERNGTFPKSLNIDWGQKLVKIQSWIFRKNSTLLESRRLYYHNSITFDQIHCVLKVLNVEEVGEVRFRKKEKKKKL
jgi:hypothetical protein